MINFFGHLQEVFNKENTIVASYVIGERVTTQTLKVYFKLITTMLMAEKGRTMYEVYHMYIYYCI